MEDNMNYDYIAGFFDAEGSIHIFNNAGRSKYLGVSITNTNKKVLEKIHSFIGLGYIVKSKRNAESIKQDYKVCYKLRLSTRDAAKFLKSLLPYLIIKKRQAKLAIKFQSGILLNKKVQDRITVKEHNRRDDIKQNISDLCKDYGSVYLSPDNCPSYSYYAGFIDGEGCIVIRKTQHKRMKNKSYCLVLNVVNQANIFEPLKKRFGGSVSKNKCKCFSYYVSSIKAYNLLSKIEKYLIVKKKESVIGREFSEMIQKNTGKYGVNGIPVEDLNKREKYFLSLKKRKEKENAN